MNPRKSEQKMGVGQREYPETAAKNFPEVKKDRIFTLKGQTRYSAQWMRTHLYLGTSW